MEKYTDIHLAFLKEGYRYMGVCDLAVAFNGYFNMNKTAQQIKSALFNHKIVSGRKTSEGQSTQKRLLTQEQDYFLRELYRSMTQKELLIALNNTYGLSITLQQLITYLKNNAIQSGRSGCFEKGHTSWNLDTKGLTGANKSSFRKGQQPHNLKTLGHERVDRDGYVLVKVQEVNPYTGAATRYKHKHVVLWESHYGTVPDGYAVSFINADKTDFDIKNLELVSRNVLCRYNYDRINEQPREIIPALKNIAKLNVKIMERQKEVA